MDFGSRGFEADHIKPKSRYPELTDTVTNLAWACVRCNGKKSDHVEGFDAETSKFLPLFHPKKERWERHLFWSTGRKSTRRHGDGTGDRRATRIECGADPSGVALRWLRGRMVACVNNERLVRATIKKTLVGTGSLDRVIHRHRRRPETLAQLLQQGVAGVYAPISA